MSGTQTYNDVTLGRGATIAGRVTARGNVGVDHNLTVKGWLDARNIRGASKGLFKTGADLKKFYPRPQPGWWALVGDTLPAELWLVVGGEWSGTGELCGEPTIWSQEVEELQDEVAEHGARIGENARDIAALRSRATSLETRVTALESGSASSPGDAGDAEARAQVLPFDGIEKVSAGAILEMGKGGTADGPSYQEGVSLVFDTATKAFALKARTEDGRYEYYGDWSTDAYAYGSRQDYRDALSKQNQAVFLNRTDGKIYRYENGALIAAAGSGDIGDGTCVSPTVVGQLQAVDSSLSDRISELEMATSSDLAERVAALEAAVNPLSLSLSASPSLVKYVGDGATTEVTLTRTLRRRGADVEADKITAASISYDGAEIDDATNPNPRTVKHRISGRGRHPFGATASTADGTAAASAEVRVELPMRFGFAAAATAAELDMDSLEEQDVKSSPRGEYSLVNEVRGHHLWLCVPDTMKIALVTSNNFEVPMLAYEEKPTALGTYRCYRSAADGINPVEMTFTIT